MDKPFDNLPDDARVWIYAFEKPLGDADKQAVAERLDTFMEEWRSHNVDVHGAYAILHDRFVIMSGVSSDGISGCSIDSSVENFKFLRDRLGLDALNRDLVHFRDADGVVQALDRAAFQKEVSGGRCSADTIVFDITIGTLGDFRGGRFELPLAQSWHAKAFLTETQPR